MRSLMARGYGTYASRDLQDYRAHYPNNSEDPRKDKNLLFFRNEYPMQPEGVKIEDVLSKWQGNYRHLESSHSFIQWLFPIQEKGMNWDSQVLQKHEIASMRADPVILQRVVGVFKLMLDFYGMELVDESCGEIRRLEACKPQYRNLNYSSHNYLRITRMLKNLGEMGFEHLKIGWLSFFFEEIYVTRLLPNCESSFRNYWVGTIYDDETRDNFISTCETRAREAKKRRIENGATSTSPSASETQQSGSAPHSAAVSPSRPDGFSESEGEADSFDSSSSSSTSSAESKMSDPQTTNNDDTQPNDHNESQSNNHNDDTPKV